MDKITEKSILFFDSECPLCNKSAVWVLKATEGRLFVSSLTGNSAAQVLHFNTENMDSQSFILFHSQKIYIKGQALRALFPICKWNSIIKYVLLLTKITPLFIVNFVYNLIARNRKNICSNSCKIGSNHAHLMLP
ncbi:MAG: DCC1-like thiol-disulfide oxidoreductase family protein [Bacteroidota bacterium]